MTTTTTNYGLKKPSTTDNADLTVFVGQNMDTLDTLLSQRVQKDATYGTNTNTTNSAFRATAPGTQALTASTITKITMNTLEYDVQSEFDTTLSRFTAKTAGTYVISCCMRVGNLPASSPPNPQLFITLYKNGTEYCRMQNFVSVGLASAAYQAHGCTVVKLNAGDYVEVYGYVTVALTVQSNVGASFFSGVKIG